MGGTLPVTNGFLSIGCNSLRLPVELRFMIIGMIIVIVSAVNGTPGARRRATAIMRAWNIDDASMMTAATGGRLASPKAVRSKACKFRGVPRGG